MAVANRRPGLYELVPVLYNEGHVLPAKREKETERERESEHTILHAADSCVDVVARSHVLYYIILFTIYTYIRIPIVKERRGVTR